MVLLSGLNIRFVLFRFLNLINWARKLLLNDSTNQNLPVFANSRKIRRINVKKLTEKKRLILSELIKQNSIFSIGIVSNIEIDKLNILNATILSMKRALKKFCMLDNAIKIDGPKIFDLNEKTFFIKKGDQKSVSIASASIIAKCHRDEILKKLAINHPLYQWEKNKGYGTKKHIDAIKKFGVSNLHRKSFLSKILD